VDKTQEVASDMERQDPTVFSEELADEELIKLTCKARKQYYRKLDKFKRRYKIHYSYKDNDYDDIQFNVPLQCIRTYSF
jgi:hypothetical protein